MITPEEREYARNFINDTCIARVRPGSKRLPSLAGGNEYYIWQFYLRAALFNPFVLSTIVKDFFDKYEEKIRSQQWQLCGVESASTPILTAIMIESQARGHTLPVFSIRKERKPYGLMNWIEGSVLDRPAMLIDDLTSEAHKTAFHASNILNDHGIEIAPDFYCAVFKRNDNQRIIRLIDQNVTVGSLFDLNDFDMSLEEYQRVRRKTELTNARSAGNAVAARSETADRGRPKHRGDGQKDLAQERPAPARLE